ncbi:unnamed protein product [Caenorhabditis bovis]|uniref:Uncharacterized protein n=1 Tax=Caenorhabditis bovis TaxID=2654633 RepID=A0A8S1EHM2_9PELO|nr:unnamed protein product [Caenorhabditis bovis]
MHHSPLPMDTQANFELKAFEELNLSAELPLEPIDQTTLDMLVPTSSTSDVFELARGMNEDYPYHRNRATINGTMILKDTIVKLALHVAFTTVFKDMCPIDHNDNDQMADAEVLKIKEEKCHYFLNHLVDCNKTGIPIDEDDLETALEVEENYRDHVVDHLEKFG